MEETIQTVKRISMELRPPILDVCGLPDAIRWQGEEFQSRTGIKVEFLVNPLDIPIDSDRSTTIFRIFQEKIRIKNTPNLTPALDNSNKKANL